MPYTFEYQPAVILALKKLDPVLMTRIINKINWLGSNFDQITPQSLSENWAGFYKLRVGDYRIIYKFDIEVKIIWIEKIGHRREIYE